MQAATTTLNEKHQHFLVSIPFDQLGRMGRDGELLNDVIGEVQRDLAVKIEAAARTAAENDGPFQSRHAQAMEEAKRQGVPSSARAEFIRRYLREHPAPSVEEIVRGAEPRASRR